MLVTCERCRLEYDDTDHLTVCPHDEFPMNCVVGGGRDGRWWAITDLGQLDELRFIDRVPIKMRPMPPLECPERSLAGGVHGERYVFGCRSCEMVRRWNETTALLEGRREEPESHQDS